jgi:hypothetical protein
LLKYPEEIAESYSDYLLRKLLITTSNRDHELLWGLTEAPLPERNETFPHKSLKSLDAKNQRKSEETGGNGQFAPIWQRSRYKPLDIDIKRPVKLKDACGNAQ